MALLKLDPQPFQRIHRPRQREPFFGQRREFRQLLLTFKSQFSSASIIFKQFDFPLESPQVFERVFNVDGKIVEFASDRCNATCVMFGIVFFEIALHDCHR